MPGAVHLKLTHYRPGPELNAERSRFLSVLRACYACDVHAGPATKISLTVTLIGDGEMFTVESRLAQIRPVDGARRWRCAFPSRDCPIDPRLMETVSVAVDDLGIGKADFAEADGEVLILAGSWPSALADMLYA